METFRIAVCTNENNWHQRFLDYLTPLVQANPRLECELFDIDADDWIGGLDRFDAVIWKPNHMGIECASHFKEKIYFIEKYLGKLVIPNYSSVWHFESKVAQKYLLERFNIPTPRSVATFNYQDALSRLDGFSFPVVFKGSSGAASTNVRLLKTREEAVRSIRNLFCHQAAEACKLEKGASRGRYSLINLRSWWQRKRSGPNQPVAYWQEFLPGNDADLRITVIGNRFAFGFWRKNRPNDFRASGSGRIDYATEVPEAAIRFCLELNARFDFDSMAYDLLFSGGDFKIVEISFGYVDTAIHNAPGYHELADGALVFHPGNYWPQEMWVKWGVMRIEEKLRESSAGCQPEKTEDRP